MAKQVATAERTGKKRGRKPKEEAVACVFLRRFSRTRKDGSKYHYEGDIWYICYPTIDPKTGKTKFKTKSSGSKLKSEAEKQLHILKTAHYKMLNGGASARQAPTGDMTFKAFINDVYLVDPDVLKLAGYDQVKQQTGELIGGLDERYIKVTTRGRERVYNEQHIGNVKLKDFTAERFKQYLQVKNGRNNAISTNNKHIALVMRVLNVAFQQGYVGYESVIESKKLEKKEENNSRINSLTPELVTILRDACEKRDTELRQIVEFALACGIRKNRVQSLKWTMLDLDKEKIDIPKDKHGSRFEAQLGPTALKVLHERLEHARKDGPEFVFFNPKTMDAWVDKKRVFNRAVKDAIAEATKQKINPQGLVIFTFHDTRHTFISSLVNEDVPFDQVQKLAGHKDSRSTERYTHRNDKLMKDAVGKLPY
jgi:integrase